MAKDGLSYYSGVGRGKGTIIQPPNLLPIFQNLGKQAAAQKQARDKGLQDATKQMADLADLGDKGFIEDYEYLASIRDDFENKVVSTYTKYDGAPPPSETARLLNDKNKAMNKLQQSQKQGDQYFYWQKVYANPNLDNETRKEGIELLNQWRELRPEERPDLNQFIAEKKFDYTKFTTGLANLVNKEALQVARDSGIQMSPNGKFVRTETYKYTTLPIAQKVVNDAYTTDPMYMRETDRLYADFQKKYPNGQIEYTEYVDDGRGGIVPQKTTKVVTNVDDFKNYVQAPALTSMQERDNVSMSSSVSVGITPTSASDAMQQTAELAVRGTDDNQYGFSADSYSSVTGYNLSPATPGAKSRKGSALPGSYALDPDKTVNNSQFGDMVVSDHYKLLVASQDIELTKEQAAGASLVDPTAVKSSGGKYYLKKGAPIPTQYRDDPVFSGKTGSADYITYEIVYSYNADGSPRVKKQYTVDASLPQTRQWLDANMMEQNGKKFTEWYFGWKPGKTPSGGSGGGSTTPYGGNVR